MTVNRRRASPALRRRACVSVGLGITLFAAQAGAASVDAPAPASDADAASGGGTLPAISVSGARDNALRARTASVAGYDDAPLRDTPASVSVVTRALLDDQQAKRLSDVVRNDASVSNAYAPVGYFEGFSIRGFPVDLASAIRIDGLTVSGEQNVPLENKERVEILKGLAGIDSGVVAPGGVINFVTKRSANVASVTTGVDSRGSTSAAVDLGQRFGPGNQFGIRINAAKENMHSYIDGTNGRRTFGSIAADWDISPRASLQLNAEFQQWIQRSAPGYQLLGGTVVPSVKSTSKALGTQPWAKPLTTDALNLNARFDYQFNDDWKAYVAAGRSRTMIDDNSAFAYGCSSAGCAPGGASPFFFGRNGDFDVYDFRSPGEYRRNDDVRAVTTGKFSTGPVRHELTVGASVQRRVVHMADAVYDYVGSENIYGPDLTFAPSQNVAGPSYPRLDAWQYAVFGADRISFGDHWQVLAGGKEVLLRQRSWSSLDGPQTRTDRSVFLPQVALVYKPVNALSLYASYSKALSLGDQAPVRASNAYAFLPPVESHQIEVGAKYDWLDRLSLTAAVFSISKPFQFAQPDASNGSYTFVQRGTQRHQGIELGAAGRLTQRLSLTATVAAIRARAYDSGSPAYEGHQVINVPALRASLYADYAVPGVAGLALLGGVDYSASRNANEEGTARVPAWFVFNLGARYATKIGGHRTVLRVSVDNLFNKFYWRDAGEQQGDAYLFPGAPRTARVSLTYDF
ncbi:TonB-dependent siderophore receptor [Burkholderia ubonensis]|uniref:TonB-dependent siderophore receptor n=1 Tax=Burkholderia ubonensis subsp. mesacidophila TaxID=265293 RepID=A0A2A4FMS9_9BURK|nr:TonB-dependent siderophore receptor [Burkholderia ubonensis]PCE33970.1 TonB-dependent siderophore receptor [Burkholderia ubonensis subsp. mesacidophila]